MLPQRPVPGLQGQPRVCAGGTQAPVRALQGAVQRARPGGAVAQPVRSRRPDRQRGPRHARPRLPFGDRFGRQGPVAVAGRSRRTVGLRPRPALGRGRRARAPWRAGAADRRLPGADRRRDRQHPGRAGHRRQDRGGAAGPFRHARCLARARRGSAVPAPARRRQRRRQAAPAPRAGAVVPAADHDRAGRPAGRNLACISPAATAMAPAWARCAMRCASDR